MEDKILAAKRDQIDKIDEQIARLLNQRFKYTLELGQIKKKLHLPVKDERRENEVLERVAKASRSNFSLAIKQVFKSITQVSRLLQQR